MIRGKQVTDIGLWENYVFFTDVCAPYPAAAPVHINHKSGASDRARAESMDYVDALNLLT